MNIKYIKHYLAHSKGSIDVRYSLEKKNNTTELIENKNIVQFIDIGHLNMIHNVKYY